MSEEWPRASGQGRLALGRISRGMLPSDHETKPPCTRTLAGASSPPPCRCESTPACWGNSMAVSQLCTSATFQSIGLVDPDAGRAAGAAAGVTTAAVTADGAAAAASSAACAYRDEMGLTRERSEGSIVAPCALKCRTLLQGSMETAGGIDERTSSEGAIAALCAATFLASLVSSLTQRAHMR